MKKLSKSCLALAAVPSAALAAVSANSSTTPVQQGQTNGVNNPAETISFEGQGSLNKIIGSVAFGYWNLTGTSAQPTFTLNNGPGGTPTTYSDTASSGSAYLNLASQDFTKPDVGVNTPSTAQQTHSALRLEWHWNGTVDGSNDLINDQIGYDQTTGSVAPQQGANRGPSVANPIYVNATNHFDGTTSGSGANNLVTLKGLQVSNNGGTGTYNTYSPSNYDPAGNNLLGGTNRVQFSFSDYKTIDYSAPGTPSVFAAPGSAGYGLGNPVLKPANNNLLGIGVNQAREAYQPGTIANMPTTHVDPSTVSATTPGGSTYAAGPWNTAGLDNLSSTPVAANAVLIAANPGTGLSRLNKADSQWLQTTGRLANGMQFNAVTRDADLGQRPSFATATGIDGTWAVGLNDGGDTTTTANATLQRSLGTIKFSGKSSDTEVYNTIAQSRMGAGVLALTSTIAANSFAPVRSLHIDFNDTTDPQLSGGGGVDTSKFVAANLNTISNYTYQAVLLGYVTTAKSPNGAALAAYKVANPGLTDAQAWAAMQSFNPANPNDPTVTGIKGDTTGDVTKFLTNLLNSQGTYQSLTTTNDPADAFLNNSYLLPNLLTNQRDPSTGLITANPNYDPAAFTKATSIYANKFNADYAGSFGKVTETTGTGSYYGGAANNSTGSAGLSPPNFNGPIPITALNADGSTAPDAALAPRGNWLFGNFNQTGVRDLSAVESALAAAKALYAIEPAGTSAPNSAFNGSGSVNNAANSTAVTYTGVDGVSHTMTKGDLIVMGDYLGAGKFDGASLAALARGAATSDATDPGFTAGTLSGGISGFADSVRNGISRKNDGLAYLQSNTADGSAASTFLRQSARAVLAAPAVPRNATPLGTTDPSTGYPQFTYDPAGSNAFNNHDVNGDGVVDFNDAVVVDNANTLDYTNLTQQLAATQQAPVTGATQNLNLVALKQTDGSTTINGSDLAAINTGLTAPGATNWYGYTLTKTGPGTVTFARATGTVTVYPGATFNLSAGKVTVASPIDPFTDSAALGTDTTQSVALTVAGTLEYTSSVKLIRLATLTVPTGGAVALDPNPSHAVLAIGSLALTGGVIDIADNDLVLHTGTVASVTSQLGTGLVSSTAVADSYHLTAIGIILNIGLYSAAHPFDGVAPAPGDILVKYTYFGDANLDGKVDGSDYSLIDNGYQTHSTGWYNGDFNSDGVVDGSDYTLIDNAFNRQTGALAPTAVVARPTALAAEGAPVPEPIVVPFVAAIALGGRRRRVRVGRTALQNSPNMRRQELVLRRNNPYGEGQPNS